MSDRIDEYHGAEAKVLTTDEVERWQEFLGDGIQFRRTLATTRALEKAEAELDSAMFARDRYANTIGLIESAVGFSGANPVEETIEHVRRLKAERDAALARVAELEKTLGDSAKSRDWPCLDCQPESPEKASLKTLVAELVTALAGLERRFLDPRPGDPGGPCWCSEDRPRWMGHDDHCDAARDALAKAKGARS